MRGVMQIRVNMGKISLLDDNYKTLFAIIDAKAWAIIVTQ